MLRRLAPRAALALLIVTLYLLGAFEPLERSLLSSRFGLTERASQAEVVVVGIDPRSLEALDVWPWDRGLHATVLENLLRAGASRVGFDVDFSSRSTDPEQDRQLAAAFAAAGSGRVVLPTFRQRDASLRGGPAETRPLPTFRDHTTLASINIRPDGDGIVRGYPGSGTFDGRPVPSFAAALAGREPRPGTSFLPDFGIRPASVPHLSYLDVLVDRFDQSRVEGRAVIIGATAVELGDTVPVPRWSAIPGPVLQALAFESLTENRALARSPAWAVALATVLLTLAGAVPLARWPWRRGLFFVVAASTGLFCLAWLVQAARPLTLDTVPLHAALIGSYLMGLVQRVDRQGLSLILQSLRLRRAESMMRQVVENSFDAIFTLDGTGIVESCNHAACGMFAATTGELIGRRIDELVPEWGSSVELGGRPVETRGKGLAGAEFPLELLVVEAQDDPDGRRVCFLRDITERKTHEHALKHQATHDALTGLPNRILLRDRVEQAIREADRSGTSLAFLILDLDRFKEVNDTLGHHVGDLLLQQVPGRLTGPLRRSDTIARLGGDEFAVLLPGADAEAASEIAGRLAETLAEPFKLYGVTLPIEVSIGIALYPDHGTSPTELIQRADVAMYVAKRSRSELAVYEADKDFTSLRHLTLSGELHRAIRENQLLLHFQPKFGCRDGELNGVEALVRWNHPKHGLVPPIEFIGVAEHTGLIKPLSHWVMRAAIDQCSEWRDRGVELPVAVNLSARNLQEEGFVERLARLLQDADLPPRLLTLEITESVLVEDWEHSSRVLLALSELGVRISIDDFGTGYSSLAYLKQLPAQEIKIDRAFVSELDRDEEDAVIVRSTIDMAHNLGLQVVAEGVEGDAVLRRLRELGCDSAQGFYLARPAPADELIDLLQKIDKDASLV